MNINIGANLFSEINEIKPVAPIDGDRLYDLSFVDVPDPVYKKDTPEFANQIINSLKELHDIGKSFPMILTHIDICGSGVEDKDLIPVHRFISTSNVHTIYLSHNHISKVGFEKVLRNIPNSKVKHLAFDKNRIHFESSLEELDERFSQIFIGKNCHLQRCENLETLNISYNYITKELIDRAAFEYSKSDNVHGKNFNGLFSYYFPIRGKKCQVIFKQKLLVIEEESLVPTITQLGSKELSEETDFISESKSCVAYVEKKSMWQYSNHVFLVIEQILEGQRKLQTAELVLMRATDYCKVIVSDVAPFTNGIQSRSLQSRLAKYKPPAIGYFNSQNVTDLVLKVSSSRNNVGMKLYGLDKTDEGVLLNCVDWANLMMQPLIQSKLSNLRIPFLLIVYYFIRKYRDLIFPIIIVFILILIAFFLQ